MIGPPTLNASPTAPVGQTSVTGLVRLLALSQLALVAATWKLWTPQTVFPQVPLIRVACDWPGWIDWLLLAGLIGSSILLVAFPRFGAIRRSTAAVSAGCLAGLFVLDQHRLQPWAWQFFLLLVLASLASDPVTRRCWFWLTVSIYFWSAVSKLDVGFFNDQGPALLGGLKQAVGIRGMPTPWTQKVDFYAAMSLPLGEAIVALLMAWPRTRWHGLWLAIVMHTALLFALGPLGLNHSYGVLLWNAYFIVQDLLLFRDMTNMTPLAGHRPAIPIRLLEPDRRWPNRLAITTIAAAILWPSLEPFGYCDHWLAWAVYSGRTDRAYLVQTEGSTDGRIAILATSVDLQDWSLSSLGAPIYPEYRFQVGVGLALDPTDWRPMICYRARRTALILNDASELDAAGQRFWLNTRPRTLSLGCRPATPGPSATRILTPVITSSPGGSGD